MRRDSDDDQKSTTVQNPNDMSTTVSVTRVSASPTPHKRKSPAGKTITDIVHSAHMGSNAEVFRMVMDLHVPAGAGSRTVAEGSVSGSHCNP